MKNSLTQYIDLFKTHRAVIDSHAPMAFNRRRAHALEVLENLPRLPERGDEGFPKISLNEMFAPDYGINISRVDFGIPQMAAGCGNIIAGQPAAVVVNDSFKDCGATLPSGVEVCSIVEAAERYPRLFEDEIAPSDNPIVALNDLLVQDGVFIRIHGDIGERPIQILSLYNSATPMMGVRRVRIHLDEDASGSVLMCDHPLSEAAGHLSCRVVEVSIEAGVSLNFYDLEEAGADSRRASVFASEQKEGSTLNVCSLFLNGGMTRNEFYPRHLGEHCETRLGGLVIGGNSQIIDHAVSLTHAQPKCISKQLFKYALFDASQGSFEGIVKVNREAVHTQAHQNNRNLLASADARMYAMPQLEIYCDEVKASHGSATGQLDERALFYMRQRGIPEEEARMMLVNAFMTDVLDSIVGDALRERLRHLVEVRLRGADQICSGCQPA